MSPEPGLRPNNHCIHNALLPRGPPLAGVRDGRSSISRRHQRSREPARPTSVSTESAVNPTATRTPFSIQTNMTGLSRHCGYAAVHQQSEKQIVQQLVKAIWKHVTKVIFLGSSGHHRRNPGAALKINGDKFIGTSHEVSIRRLKLYRPGIFGLSNVLQTNAFVGPPLCQKRLRTATVMKNGETKRVMRRFIHSSKVLRDIGPRLLYQRPVEKGAVCFRSRN